MVTLMHNEAESATLTPKDIIENYQRAYRHIHGQEPHVSHLFAEWYQVNGETVHRVSLFGEISRLRGLAQQQRLQKADKGVLQRLITRLRGL